MAFAVTSTVERRLGRSQLQDKDAGLGRRYIPTQIYLPWENRYREVSAEERQPVSKYRKVYLMEICVP